MIGVCYLFHGAPHVAHQLTVSLWTLRRHYHGEVAILLADPDRQGYIRRIADERRLAPVQIIPIPADSRDPRLCKTTIPGHSPFAKTIFLDADTLVVGGIDELWPIANEWVFTQLSDWVTTGPNMRRIIQRWADADPQAAARLLAKPHPAINTGVFAFSGDGQPWASKWHDTARRPPCTGNDEPAATLVYQETHHRLLDSRFNALVRHGRIKGARILHGQANSFFKHKAGRNSWYPVLAEVLRLQVANLARYLKI